MKPNIREGLSAGVIANAAVSVALGVLCVFAFDFFHWRWALAIALVAAINVVGLLIWVVWRTMRSPFDRSLFKTGTNDYFIEGPASRIFLSVAGLLLFALYGAYGIVSGRIFLLLPWGIETFRGLAAALLGIAFIVASCGSMVRFHTRYRRAELAFGSSLLIFFLLFFLAVAIHDAR